MSESEPTLNAEDEKQNFKRKRFFWKGKLVSEKVYRKRIQQIELAKSLHREEFRKRNSNLKHDEKKITGATSTNNKDTNTAVLGM